MLHFKTDFDIKKIGRPSGLPNKTIKTINVLKTAPFFNDAVFLHSQAFNFSLKKQIHVFYFQIRPLKSKCRLPVIAVAR